MLFCLWFYERHLITDTKDSYINPDAHSEKCWHTGDKEIYRSCTTTSKYSNSGWTRFQASYGTKNTITVLRTNVWVRDRKSKKLWHQTLESFLSHTSLCDLTLVWFLFSVQDEGSGRCCCFSGCCQCCQSFSGGHGVSRLETEVW